MTRRSLFLAWQMLKHLPGGMVLLMCFAVGTVPSPLLLSARAEVTELLPGASLRGTVWQVTVTDVNTHLSIQDRYRFYPDGHFSADSYAGCSAVRFTEDTSTPNVIRFRTGKVCSRERGEAASVRLFGSVTVDGTMFHGHIRNAAAVVIARFHGRNVNLRSLARHAIQSSLSPFGTQGVSKKWTPLVRAMTDVLEELFHPVATLADRSTTASQRWQNVEVLCRPTYSFPGGVASDSDHDRIPDAVTVDFGTTGCDLDADGTADLRNAFHLRDLGQGVRLEFVVDTRHFQIAIDTTGSAERLTLGGAFESETTTSSELIQFYDMLSFVSPTQPRTVINGQSLLSIETRAQSLTTTIMLQGNADITVGTRPLFHLVFYTVVDTQDSDANKAYDLYEMATFESVTQGRSSTVFSSGPTPLTGNFETCAWPLVGTLTIERGTEVLYVKFSDPTACALATVTVSGIVVGVYDLENGTWQ